MLQRSLQRAALQAKAFLYGIPDRRALPLFKRLRSTFAFDVPRFVRVVRASNYVSKILPAWIAAPAAAAIDFSDRVFCAIELARGGPITEWSDSFDSRFDELWRRVDTTRLIIGERSSRFLKWRFPLVGRRTLVFVARQPGNATIHTYVVGEVESNLFVVKDLLTITSGEELRKTMYALVVATRQLGVHAISVSMLPTATVQEALVRSHFVTRDSRSFFCTWANDPSEALIKASWYITGADEDM
jgi:hypothetical protein